MGDRGSGKRSWERYRRVEIGTGQRLSCDAAMTSKGERIV